MLCKYDYEFPFLILKQYTVTVGMNIALLLQPLC